MPTNRIALSRLPRLKITPRVLELFRAALLAKGRAQLEADGALDKELRLQTWEFLNINRSFRHTDDAAELRCELERVLAVSSVSLLER